MNLICWTYLALAIPLFTEASVPFNLSSATCYLPEEGAKIDLHDEWSAFEASGQDGYCYDVHGNGFRVNQTFMGCEGCITYTCISRPCRSRDGATYKLWWEPTSVEDKCCSDCHGRGIPPNKGTSSLLTDPCSTLEKTLCLLSPTSTGQLEVTYESQECCRDESGLVHTTTSILEPATCSMRTCEAGSPAFWRREAILQGCNCCLFNNSLVSPGATVDISGVHFKCCDGQLLVEQVQTNKTSTINTPTPATKRPTTTRITTTTSTATTTFITTTTTAGPDTTTAPTTSTTTSTTSTTSTTTSTFSTTTTVTTADPCKSYKLLNDPKRSASSALSATEKTCDTTGYESTNPDWAGPGWYRFSGLTYNTLPDQPSGLNNACGSYRGGWLNGTHPSVVGQEKSGQVCFQEGSSSNTCMDDVSVKIRNCASYYVYYLPNVPICTARYCNGQSGSTLVNGGWSSWSFGEDCERKRRCSGSGMACTGAAVDKSWKIYQKGCYKRLEGETTKEAYKYSCRNEGGQLASVHSSEENNFLVTLLRSDSFLTFLGGSSGSNCSSTDIGRCAWDDGSTWDYRNWGNGQPDGDKCIFIGYKPFGLYKMVDHGCSHSSYDAICKVIQQ